MVDKLLVFLRKCEIALFLLPLFLLVPEVFAASFDPYGYNTVGILDSSPDEEVLSDTQTEQDEQLSSEGTEVVTSEMLVLDSSVIGVAYPSAHTSPVLVEPQGIIGVDERLASKAMLALLRKEYSAPITAQSIQSTELNHTVVSSYPIERRRSLLFPVRVGSRDLNAASLPEPGSFFLLGFALLFARRFRKRVQS